MSVAPRGAAEVVSPDACTHLTGQEHVTSLTAALDSVTAQLDALDGWGCVEFTPSAAAAHVRLRRL